MAATLPREGLPRDGRNTKNVTTAQGNEDVMKAEGGRSIPRKCGAGLGRMSEARSLELRRRNSNLARPGSCY
jgi:hypothetical protein